VHEVAEGLERGVRRAEDVVVIAGVDGGGDEGGGFGVGAGDGEEVDTWVCVLAFVSCGFVWGGWEKEGEAADDCFEGDSPMMSAWARIATSRLMCSLMGTSTLPAMCPHFFVPGAWSSMWMPAAPFSTKSFVSFMIAVRPP
jgi:hypothetical protein